MSADVLEPAAVLASIDPKHLDLAPPPPLSPQIAACSPPTPDLGNSPIACHTCSSKINGAAGENTTEDTTTTDTQKLQMSELFGDDATSLPHEDDDGVCEYKLKLIEPTPERFTHLVTQLIFRLNEGQGECLYEIGVQDDGTIEGLNDAELNQSLHTLELMAREAGAITQQLRRRPGCADSTLSAAEVLVRRRQEDQPLLDIRMAVAGNVDSGKSTLVGVLASGAHDNGRGQARSLVFKHKHELENGRTSCITQEILGFDEQGKIVNSGSAHSSRALAWDEIVARATKIVTFIDLAGHEKYLKTTVFGMTGCLPDYVMICIGANMGITRMTKEHLGIALALRLPICVVITKIDICPPNILEETLTKLQKILKGPAAKKFPTLMLSDSDVLDYCQQQAPARVVPIFQCSNVTGVGLDPLRLFLNLLPARAHWDREKPAEFYMDEHFFVTGVGTVAAGTLMAGCVKVNDQLMLGPDGNGRFQRVTIKTIHSKRCNVERVFAGQSASFGLKKIKRSALRKGMVLASPALDPKSSWEFEAEILVLQHPTTIQPGYQPVIHCIAVRQAARILSVTGNKKSDSEVLRTGDRAIVRFRFAYRPEYLLLGARLVFREGRCKGIGRVSKVEHNGAQ